ncbi:MAG TPA: NYN domain-containing protein [Chthoniobacteraceae bacterium]|nr:NYN domain-containing protein [Chthoniobacteraceae bacterium]
MARYLIVDAYSIIYAWPDLRALHERRLSLAREALLQRLTHFHDTGDYRVVVVFDGKGSARANEATVPGGIQVFYSGNGLSADAIIERLVAKYAGQHALYVATADHLEAQTVISFGATSCLSPEMLRTMIEESEREFQRLVEKRRRR